MGIFSFFKKEENYEEILATLEHDIKRARKQQAESIERTNSWVRAWTTYTFVAWVAYVAGFLLYVWPDRHTAQAGHFLFHIAALLIIPVAIYQGSVAIKAVGRRALDGHDRKVSRLNAELAERLDELKKKTAFDTTKTLIDRYSAQDKPAGVPAKLKQQQMQDLKNRRRTMPNFGTPATEAMNKAGSAPTSPLAVKSMQRGQLQNPALLQLPNQPGMASRQQQMTLGSSDRGGMSLSGTGGLGPGPELAVNGVYGTQARNVEAGVVRVSPRSASAQPAGSDGNARSSRPWLDKLVDQLVGDVGSAEDKYALVCRHCYAHNGLVLEEEIQDIQYNCPKCGKFNESVRALREKASSTGGMPARTEQQSSFSDGDESDSSDEYVSDSEDNLQWASDGHESSTKNVYKDESDGVLEHNGEDEDEDEEVEAPVTPLPQNKIRKTKPEPAADPSPVERPASSPSSSSPSKPPKNTKKTPQKRKSKTKAKKA
ncbi:hypothetical protein GQ54DRAFT_299386 [Martensiomyces pterosporus]|nr:hypothetical protein GQ54DRAFT_299386 [Martensiomyces pterosporus]